MRTVFLSAVAVVSALIMGASTTYAIGMSERLQVYMDRIEINVSVLSINFAQNLLQTATGTIKANNIHIGYEQVPSILNDVQVEANGDRIYYSKAQLENFGYSVYNTSEIDIKHLRDDGDYYFLINPDSKVSVRLQTVTSKMAPIYGSIQIYQSLFIAAGGDTATRHDYQIAEVDLSEEIAEYVDKLPERLPVKPVTVVHGPLEVTTKDASAAIMLTIQYYRDVDNAGSIITQYVFAGLLIVAAFITLMDFVVHGRRNRGIAILFFHSVGNVVYLVLGGLVSTAAYFAFSVLYSILTMSVEYLLIFWKFLPMWLHPFGKVFIQEQFRSGSGAEDIQKEKGFSNVPDANWVWLTVGGLLLCGLHGVWMFLSIVSIAGLLIVEQHKKLAMAILQPEIYGWDFSYMTDLDAPLMANQEAPRELSTIMRPTLAGDTTADAHVAVPVATNNNNETSVNAKPITEEPVEVKSQ